MGAIDKKHINGTISYLPVTDPSIWQFSLKRIVVNFTLPLRNKSFQFCVGGCSAYPNTGDSLIYGPPKEIKDINRLLSAHYVPYIDRYEVSNYFPAH